MKLLAEMNTDKCKSKCKSVWLRNFRYALKTTSNPLRLTNQQRKTMTEKIKIVAGRRPQKTRKAKKI